MYSSFKILAVSDENELRDPRRIRRLRLHYHRGLWWACACLGLAGTCSLAVSAAMLWGLHAGRIPDDLEIRCGTVVVFLAGLIGLAMAAAFRAEIRSSPLTGCIEDPAAYDFAPAALLRARFPHSDRRSSRKALVEGETSPGNRFLTEFSAALWSRNVAEGGESKHLNEDDDFHDLKGRRVRPPLDCWVVYRRGEPRRAALVGLPKRLVDRLRSPE